jgi:tetratricopeptide (TPR) repeat protein
MSPSTVLLLLLLAQAAETGDPATLLARGTSALEAKRFTEARPLLEEAHRLRPEDPESGHQLARLLLEDKETMGRAVGLLEDAVARAPGVSAYHLTLGLAYSRQASDGLFRAMGLAGKIEVEFQQAVELAPTSVPARQALHGFFMRAPGFLGGSLEKAGEQATALAALDPFAGSMAWLAIHARRKAWTEFDQAARSAARSAADDKGRARLTNLLIDRGYEALQASDTVRAVRAFRLATEVEPSNPNAHDSLGEALIAREDWGEAEVEYRRSLALGPGPRIASASHFGLGRALEGRGDWPGARASYQAALAEATDPELLKRARARMESLGVPPTR